MSSEVEYVPVGTAPPITTAPQIGFVVFPPQSPTAPSEVTSSSELPPPSYDEIYKDPTIIGLNPIPTVTTSPPPARFEVTPVHLKRESTAIVCPYCFRQTMTTTDETYSDLVDCCVCFLCLIGCPICLCCVPYYVCDAEKVDHFCGECKQYIGISYEDNPLLWDQYEQIRREQMNEIPS